MKYIGQFRDINNTLYTVEITTDRSGANANIVLADDPVVFSIDGGDANIYKAGRYSSATVRLFSKDYNFDLYSKTAQQNKLVISRSSEIVWSGYITSNLYNAGYENSEEVIEVEAIDALSTLQYYEYVPVRSNRGIATFADIIKTILKKCNAYTHFYFPDNTQLHQYIHENLLDRLSISEENFFDEDGEGMKMQEVLEEICKYMGVTVTAHGNKVYFVDYDAIKNGINSYYEYNLSTGNEALVTLSHSKDIAAADYTENGSTISLDNVYNKVVVKDSLYSFDSIIPSIWDDDYLTNYSGSGHIQEVDEDGKGGMHKCFFKYYKHKNYKSYYYNKVSLQPVAAPSKVDYKYTQDYVGATICRHYSEKVTSYDTKYSDIGFQDYLLLHCHNTTNVDDTVKRKLFELEVNDAKSSFLGGNTYIIIKGSFRYMDRPDEMYIMEGYMNKDDNFNPARLYIWARLQYGNRYWDGTAWTTTPSDFKLFYDDNGNTDHCINQVFQIKNNITYDMGLNGEEGYSIPMPSQSEVVTGKPTFTLYQPYKLDKSYRCDAVWLSNFDIIAVVQNFDSDKERDSDTEYSNVINEDYINEFDDEEFKICTWDNKEANYSAVAYYNNGGFYTYLDKVYNTATKQFIRAEEHYIYRLVSQYKEPATILNLNLKNEFKPYSIVTDSNNLPGKKFIVDTQEIYLKENKSVIKLVEKK